MSDVLQANKNIFNNLHSETPQKYRNENKKGSRTAFIYRNAKFVEKIELEDPKDLEIQFKNNLIFL